ncbi:MAG: TldE/PmbA family protein [Alphaproteobacteria bacterium]|nr:TldE/PmbA family protein [Alphaproteobacteria bacterium]
MNFRDHFAQTAETVEALTRNGETSLTNYYGEQSDFLRFNKSAVRQPGSVTDCEVTVDLIAGKRRTSTSLRLTGTKDEDRTRLEHAIAAARTALEGAPQDPHLAFNAACQSSEHVAQAVLPSKNQAVEAIARTGNGRDMVGIYAAGRIAYGFANNLGQRNWHESDSFNLDWCFYHAADKAVKANYAGVEWQDTELDRIAGSAAKTLSLLSRPVKTIAPGGYRAYLTPSALHEIWSWLGWGGFGLANHRTRATPFLRTVDGTGSLHRQISVKENTVEGLAPGFQSDGFVKPQHVDLLSGGSYRDCLVSPRSAVEYGVKTNGANEGELPQSIDMAAGTLARDRALKELGTGVYISNLWYMNYSDRNNGRVTGLTRFASMWVENGEIVAPLGVMRLDDSIYRFFGSELEALTAERDFIIDASSYGRRSVDSMRLPGALVRDFRFTL